MVDFIFGKMERKKLRHHWRPVIRLRPIRWYVQWFQVGIFLKVFTNSAGGYQGKFIIPNGGRINLEPIRLGPKRIECFPRQTKWVMEAKSITEFDVLFRKLLHRWFTSAGYRKLHDIGPLAYVNWRNVLGSRKRTNGTNSRAAYNHSIANIMTTCSLGTRIGKSLLHWKGSKCFGFGRPKVFKYWSFRIFHILKQIEGLKCYGNLIFVIVELYYG